MELSCCDVHKLHSSSSACEVNPSNGWMLLSDIISLIGIILTENLSKLILWHTWCRGAFLLKEIFTVRPWSLNTRLLWSIQTCVNTSIMATNQNCPTAALAILSLLFETCYNQIMTCSIILSWLLASHITTYHLRPTNICIQLPPPISTCLHLPTPTTTWTKRHPLHHFAPTCTRLPPSAPTCTQLHPPATTYIHLPLPATTWTSLHPLAPACTYLHQLAPTCTNLPPSAPNCTNLHSPAAVWTYLCQIASTSDHL